MIFQFQKVNEDKKYNSLGKRAIVKTDSKVENSSIFEIDVHRDHLIS